MNTHSPWMKTGSVALSLAFALTSIVPASAEPTKVCSRAVIEGGVLNTKSIVGTPQVEHLLGFGPEEESGIVEKDLQFAATRICGTVDVRTALKEGGCIGCTKV